MSERLERELSWSERAKLRLHLLVCNLCRGFAREFERLRRLAGRYGDEPSDDSINPSARLSDETRHRLEQLVKDEAD